MRRARPLLAVVAATCLLGACRDHEVTVEFSPSVGDRYRYRYEVTTTLTRSVEGEATETSSVATELVAEQEVVALTPEGARVEVALTREGGSQSTVVAIIDRAGSLEGIELVEGLDASVFGIGDPTGLVTDPAEGLPTTAVRPGSRWTVEDGARQGHGRLERFGVEDRHGVAIVRTATQEALGQGRVQAGSLTSYDLADGAVRSGRSWSHGRLDAVVQPPAGVQAEPRRATVRYDVEVRVARLD